MTAFTKCIFAILTLFNLSPAHGQQGTVDSLKTLLEKETTDSGRIIVLLALGDQYINKRADSIMYYNKLALELNNRKIKSPEFSYEAGFGIANAYRIMGNYPEALKLLLENLKMAEQRKDTADIFFSKREIMWVYRGTGDITEQKKLLNELEELSGQVYKTNPARGKMYYRIVYNNKAGIFKDGKQYDSARYYYSALYQSTLSDHNMEMNTISASGLSDVYYETGNFDSALYYCRIGSKSALEAKRLDFYRRSYLKFAKIYFRQGSIDSALQYAYLGLNEFKTYSDTSRSLSEVLLLLSRLNEKKKRYDSAYYYLAAYYEQDNQDVKQQRINDVHNISMQEILNQKAIEQKIQAERGRYESRLKIYGLSGGLTMLLLLALFLSRNNHQKHKANQLLQQKNEQIENALSELKSTQEQLIHAEKMASLGELTAGIAHEIQNPLNFVNNFSDVNKDLVDELKDELLKGNIKESVQLADALKENEAMINVHGKRADAIVKGMLQHSRTSSEQKELADINKLADEYLRLSYHGFRTRNKSFNSELETDYDNFIGKLNILPQDMGRVFLNLYNNAFYSVAERKSKEGDAFLPRVTVTTRKIDGKVEIRISDNGIGIPEENRSKIFQPFFTTKPSGHGTGLGLSLSYDIVKKAHNGELLVENVPGGGAAFRIIIPV
jgi:two-component system NtrC family sensor kinase